MHTWRISCEDEGRDQNDATLNQGIPNLATKSLEQI